MGQRISTAPSERRDRESDPDDGWAIVQAAARAATRQPDAGHTFALAADGQLTPVAAGDPAAVLRWRAGEGWEAALASDDPRRAVIDLYLPICSAAPSRPITLGHLGQSLDGFIATRAGESHWITGEQNILHMHRLRALSDAVVVGAGTVAADNPQLTTRLVAGSNPVRVVIDPGRRLAAHYRIFTDDVVETLYVCARSLTRAGECHVGRAAIVGVEGSEDAIDAAELIRVLHARGCARVFVEGGGVTVSSFLESDMLDRLQITVAPVLIGDGRPAIRLPPCAALGDCPRPRYRVFRMGGDVLFDFDLRSARGPGVPGEDAETERVAGPLSVTRVI